MIGIGTLITLAVIAAVSGAVYGVWSYFANFVIDVMNAVAAKIKKLANMVFAGVKCFLERTAAFIKEIVKSYTYNKELDRWTVTTTEREIPPDKVESEVPADILARVRNTWYREHDVTDKIELKLKGCV